MQKFDILVNISIRVIVFYWSR